MNEGHRITESASVGVSPSPCDGWHWKVNVRVDEYQCGIADVLGRIPDDSREYHGNIVMNGGADVLWERLVTANPTTAANGLLSAFSTLAALGVGPSTASSGTQTLTNLVSTQRVRVVMDSGFPTHSTGTSTSARSAQFKATFSTAQANFAWREWGLFNAAGSTVGRMLSRKVENLGTKTSSATWALTVTYTIN